VSEGSILIVISASQQLVEADRIRRYGLSSPSTEETHGACGGADCCGTTDRRREKGLGSGTCIFHTKASNNELMVLWTRIRCLGNEIAGGVRPLAHRSLILLLVADVACAPARSNPLVIFTSAQVGEWHSNRCDSSAPVLHNICLRAVRPRALFDRWCISFINSAVSWSSSGS
jgi:hypothetical protein